MKIQMRPVGEKLDSAVSRFSYRFQEINRHSPASMDLRRDSELHEGIVQERNVMIDGYVRSYVAAGYARYVPEHECHGSAGHAAVHNDGGVECSRIRCGICVRVSFRAAGGP